jgi:hypothetical protein
MLPASVLLLAACSADTADPARETAPEVRGARSALLRAQAKRGLSRTPGAADKARRRSGEAGYAHMVYRGGPVISNVKVFTVFWNASVPNQSSLNSFYSAIVDSPYVDWLSEYNTSTQKIGRGKLLGSYVDTSAPSTTQLTDAQIQSELGKLVDNGALPQPDGDTLYMVHFPAGVSITMDGSTSCSQFCAYHSSFVHGNGTIYYGIMPDFSGACASCGGEPNALDSTTVVSSHEVAEAITDPNIGVANATQDEHQLAWYDDQNDEIGDVCEGQSATVVGYRVTKLWSNQANACIATAQSSGGTGGGGTGGGGTGGGGGGTGGGGTGGGVPTSCSSSLCTPGAPRSPTCDPCTSAICSYAPQCCSDAWAVPCAEMAMWFCPEQCF